MSTPLEVHLRAELREAKAQLAALDDRLRALQDQNEAAYRAAYDLTGGSRFDRRQPFGRLAENTFADPVKQAAARIFQRTTEETS